MTSCSEDEEINDELTRQGVIKSEQVLIIKEIFKNTKFTCHAKNQIGSIKRVINIVVKGNKIFFYLKFFF